eukprot:Protomagalhaensia_sp_Gyna_25__894@NODE_1430_length_1843_cov_223_133038_g1154_i0_p3_GENE_NODE_1430_length_1843_cov_223_133038_g1154_i0NODE_1430_length_1843_cov_223_133038_g1154_i0_p3_ORF_typecomplete_len100_score13_53_NODE_1430_length_1843_cov_223_133038_g1154_i047346
MLVASASAAFLTMASRRAKSFIICPHKSPFIHLPPSLTPAITSADWLTKPSTFATLHLGINKEWNGVQGNASKMASVCSVSKMTAAGIWESSTTSTHSA